MTLEEAYQAYQKFMAAEQHIISANLELGSAKVRLEELGLIQLATVVEERMADLRLLLGAVREEASKPWLESQSSSPAT